MSIAIGASGLVYITGYFSATVDFDPGPGIFNMSSVGNHDIFIQKLDSSRNFIWAKQMGGTDFDHGSSIAVDDFGNVLDSGRFSDIFDFDPSLTDTFILNSAGGYDVFVLKLDPLGNFIWAEQIGDYYDDNGASIAVDTLGNVFIAGYFADTVDFNPRAGIYYLTSVGNADIFVLKLDASGNFVWVKQMGGTDTEMGMSIAVA